MTVSKLIEKIESLEFTADSLRKGATINREVLANLIYEYAEVLRNMKVEVPGNDKT
jgi:hypothetical protein